MLEKVKARSLVELSELESAILAAITYRDLFDYPVSALEIHRYLHEIKCTPQEVLQALEDPDFGSAYLSTNGEWYALKHREALFDVRRRRAQLAGQLWPEALKYASWLASLPFVQMVAVTGSLAVDNTDEHADIDFMLITEESRVWTVRTLAKLLQAVDRRFSSGRLCANYIISTRALKLEEQSLYLAQELSQSVPVYDNSVYADFRKENAWVERFLPNASGAPVVSDHCVARFSYSRRLSEFLLRSPLGRAFEAWESQRKIRKYNETNFLLGRSSRYGKEATGHRRTAVRNIEGAFADRLTGFEGRGDKLRILIGQAYHMSRDPKLFKAMQPFPPLGSLYAAGVARSLGHDVRVHDSMLAHSVSEWSPVVKINMPDVVLIYEDNFNYLTKMCLLAMRDAAVEMIGVAKDRGATVLVCSSDAADEPATYLDAGADIVIAGEGEETLAQILPRIAAGQATSLSDIAGIAYRDPQGKLVQNSRRPVLRNLDDLPLPAWDLIDLDRYTEIWRRQHDRSALNLVTTRGCPYHCNWCAKPIWGQRYNARSPENVVAELKLLRKLSDFNYVWFMDDIFGLKPSWIRRFARLLREENICIQFKCLSRPDLLMREGETVALAEAGCDIVWMGAESGSQKILDAMEKGTTVEMIHNSCESLREQNIRVGLFVQFGYPGETKSDIQDTIRLIRSVMPDELGISVSYPLPGTKFHERVKSQLGQTRNWRDSDDLAMLFSGPFNTAYYRALHRYVHSDLGLRKVLRRSRSPRNVAAATYYSLRRAAAAIAMAFFSYMPHKGLDSISAELDLTAAATPSKQSAE